MNAICATATQSASMPSRSRQVSDTGAHGPPATAIKRPGRLRRALAGALFAALAAGTITTAAAAPAQATTVTSATASPESAGSGSVAHALRGTKVEIVNGTDSGVRLEYNRTHVDVPSAQSRTVEGWAPTSEFDDISGSIRANGQLVTFVGDNPLLSSAYVQFNDQKVCDDKVVDEGALAFEVDCRGGDDFGNKTWTVKVVKKWEYEFVHHTTEHDGAKGFVVNETDVPQVLEMGGGKTVLQPRERMLFYDAHEIQDGHGTEMRIYAPGHGMYDMSLIDPTAGWPRVEACLDGQHYKHKLSEAETTTLPFDNGYKVEVHRHADGPVSHYDNDANRDWAKLTISIKNR